MDFKSTSVKRITKICKCKSKLDCLTSFLGKERGVQFILKLSLCYYFGENNSMRHLGVLNLVCINRNLRLLNTQRRQPLCVCKCNGMYGTFLLFHVRVSVYACVPHMHSYVTCLYWFVTRMHLYVSVYHSCVLVWCFGHDRFRATLFVLIAKHGAESGTWGDGCLCGN